MNLKKYFDTIRLYALEEPKLELIYQISKPSFPQICLPIESASKLFSSLYICLIENPPTSKQDDVLSNLANQGHYVICTSDLDTAVKTTLLYLKQGAIPSETVRADLDDISLN